MTTEPNEPTDTTLPANAPPDVVDDGVSDVLAEDDVVHVPSAGAELAESLAHHQAEFVADVADWDTPDPQP